MDTRGVGENSGVIGVSLRPEEFSTNLVQYTQACCSSSPEASRLVFTPQWQLTPISTLHSLDLISPLHPGVTTLNLIRSITRNGTDDSVGGPGQRQYLPLARSHLSHFDLYCDPLNAEPIFKFHPDNLIKFVFIFGTMATSNLNTTLSSALARVLVNVGLTSSGWVDFVQHVAAVSRLCHYTTDTETMLLRTQLPVYFKFNASVTRVRLLAVMLISTRYKHRVV
ncbi:hypothetical protein R3P38DRAFT_2799831 [Favolaschia claudopus]|uniref:Uncharacterized protein n=1 Tax=Favolaschia claudopus TaxID=2862362 RepID=A0AAV9ZZ30_9AGAR